MAGVLDEYDEPTPVKSVYCRQLTEDQYDEEGASYTHEALKDLVKYLDKNPQAYGEIMKKRRKEEAENAGFLSYFKVKLFGYFGGEDSGFDTPSKAECLKEVDKVKKNMMNVYSYSQGQCRRSVRIAERRKKLNTSSYSPIPFSLPQAPPPPPPAPPPPPPPPPVAPPPKPFQSLTRKSINNQVKRGIQPEHDIHMELITQLKNPAIRRRLKTTNENRSPGGTPIGGWKRGKHYQSDMMPYFNKKLIDKFKSIRSPSPASPRFAESPI